MKVYKYHRTTKEFVKEVEALLDPLEGKPLCPANATFKSVPFKKEAVVAICFIDNEWAQIRDERGTTVYNKETKEESIWKELGYISKKYTKHKPKRFDSWSAKAKKWEGQEEGQFAWDKLQYRRDREASYISISEQLDMIYWDRRRLSDNWIRHIEEVKTKYPKPEDKDA